MRLLVWAWVRINKWYGPLSDQVFKWTQKIRNYSSYRVSYQVLLAPKHPRVQRSQNRNTSPWSTADISLVSFLLFLLGEPQHIFANGDTRLSSYSVTLSTLRTLRTNMLYSWKIRCSSVSPTSNKKGSSTTIKIFNYQGSQVCPLAYKY